MDLETHDRYKGEILRKSSPWAKKVLYLLFNIKLYADLDLFLGGCGYQMFPVCST